MITGREHRAAGRIELELLRGEVERLPVSWAGNYQARDVLGLIDARLADLAEPAPDGGA